MCLIENHNGGNHLIGRLSSGFECIQCPLAKQPVMVALNNQAQIESLSATSTVLVWNEPTSNATVIWVDETPGEELP